MERLLVLATIILLATVCIFLLAAGAYLLFKVRERKRENSSSLQFPHEVAPSVDLRTGKQKLKGQPPSYIPKHLKSQQQKENQAEIDRAKEEASKTLREKIRSVQKFLKYTPEGYIPPKDDKDSKTLKWR